MHAVELIYNASRKPLYGAVEGTCRITGKHSAGLLWKNWVRDTR